MKIDNPSAASLITTAREASGLSQYSLAKASGILSGQISKYERGINQPSIPALIRLIEATGHKLKIEIE